MKSCESCGKEFEHKDSADQHYAAKHSQKVIIKPKKSRKKPLVTSVLIALAMTITYFVFFGGSGEKQLLSNDDLSINIEEVPKGAIHWHPTLKIIINEQEQIIPANLGNTAGGHLPIHTHDTTGELHMETTRPTPESVTLGYFIEKILRKNFNSTCIFDSCNGPQGTLKLTVNGKPNFKFDKYVMKDKDAIVIEFTSEPWPNQDSPIGIENSS